MKGLRLFTAVGTILAAGTIAFSPMTAGAVGPDVDGVVFAGATGSLSPAIGLLPVNGTYTFSSSVCAAVSNDAADTLPEAGLCTISANGTYASISCGTGTTGGAPLAHTDAAVIAGSETVNASYGIVFLAGVGVLEGTVDGNVAAGVVDILPTGGDCVNGVTQFTAAGAAAGAGA